MSREGWIKAQFPDMGIQWTLSPDQQKVEWEDTKEAEYKAINDFINLFLLENILQIPCACMNFCTTFSASFLFCWCSFKKAVTYNPKELRYRIILAENLYIYGLYKKALAEWEDIKKFKSQEKIAEEKIKEIDNAMKEEQRSLINKRD